MNLKEVIKKFIPEFLLRFYHYLLALIGAFLYRFPSRDLFVIGVTGTSGKSSVVEMSAEVLRKAGYKTASLSSIRFKIDGEEWENKLKMTMPGRFKIQRFLRKAVDKGCRYAVLEVTSEGIKQFRHKFINFKTAVFTNLSPEHIESHRGFENYKNAKIKLFKSAKKVHIINLDDKYADSFLKVPAEKKILFSLGLKDKNEFKGGKNFKIVRAEDIREEREGISFKINNIDFNLKLHGRFNVSNALCAVCVGLSEGVSLEVCKKALEGMNDIPGRMEIVIKEPFTVVVDYAHTPTALEKVYKTVLNFKKENSDLICILGACGGGRDKWKRKVFGQIAGRFCQKIILTNEDPYDEDPQEILEMIKPGVFKEGFPLSNFFEILDRRKAISKGLSLAKEGDVVVITGKGCEPWMCVKDGKKIPWDDRDIVREEFDKLKISSEKQKESGLKN